MADVTRGETMECSWLVGRENREANPDVVRAEALAQLSHGSVSFTFREE